MRMAYAVSKSVVAMGSAFCAVVLATAAAAQPATDRAASQVGRIVLYREPTIAGLASACPIRYKGRQIVELGRGKYAEWVVPSGRYLLTNKTSTVEVSVAPGETRYVRCKMKVSVLTHGAHLQLVDEESFAARKAELTEKKVAFTPEASGASN
jgi:hypothetical protein